MVRPGSHCPKCGSRIKKYDNVPVLSWLLLGGRCRHCGARISLRYPAVELLNMLLWLLCLQRYAGVSLLFSFVAMAACSVLICVAFIDYDHMLIPDRFNFALLLLGAAAVFTGDGIPWLDRLIGCLGALAFFLLFYYGSIWILKREGLGGGDVKLMSAAGQLGGWENVLAASFIAALTACLVMLPLQGRGKEKQRGLDAAGRSKPATRPSSRPAKAKRIPGIKARSSLRPLPRLRRRGLIAFRHPAHELLSGPLRSEVAARAASAQKERKGKGFALFSHCFGRLDSGSNSNSAAARPSPPADPASPGPPCYFFFLSSMYPKTETIRALTASVMRSFIVSRRAACPASSVPETVRYFCMFMPNSPSHMNS